MFIPVTPNYLTERSIQQLRVMGLDVSLGFQRKRAIGRALNELAMSKIKLERERDRLFDEQTARAPYKKTNKIDEGRLQKITDDLKMNQQRLNMLKAHAAELEMEMAEIETWHSSVDHLKEHILEKLGVRTIEQAIPGFDDGYSVELSRAFDAGTRAR